jgi:hypothetical protein
MLMVNGVDHSFLNPPSTGGWSQSSGDADLTILLPDGATNTIKLVGGNGGGNIDYIAVSNTRLSVLTWFVVFVSVGA